MSDPNETAVTFGSDAVRAKFDTIGIGSLADFIFQGDADLVPPPMLVKGLLPFDGVAFIGGQSGAGKTFIAVDLALALATGTPFFGREVRERVGTVILAAEGRGMLAARVEAARLERAPNERRVPVAWAAEIPALMTPAEIKKFGSRLAVARRYFKTEFAVRLGAVFIDTVVSVFDMEDEDDNSEAARAIRKMRELGNASGALIVPVHHYGKTVTTGLRGGSSWRAGADAILSVLADRDDTTGEVKNRRLALAKSRDGAEGPIGRFAFRPVEIGIDSDGETFGTLVVEPILGRPIPERSIRAGKENRGVRAFREAFAEAIDTNGVQFAVLNDGPLVRAVRVQDVRAQFGRRYASGEGSEEGRSDAVRVAFKRALHQLAGQFPTEVKADGVEWVWASNG